jgi:hypothetical protein
MSEKLAKISCFVLGAIIIALWVLVYKADMCERDPVCRARKEYIRNEEKRVYWEKYNRETDRINDSIFRALNGHTR